MRPNLLYLATSDLLDGPRGAPASISAASPTFLPYVEYGGVVLGRKP